MTEPDLLLLAKAKDNDPKSLEAVIAKYKGLVAGISRGYYLTAGGDTDDLIQEGMLGLLRAVQEFVPEKNVSFATFARLCIQNRVRDAVRASSRLKHLPLSEALPAAEDSAEPAAEDPFNVYIGKESASEFMQSIQTLLSKRQLAALLLYLEGYSYREIAAKLGLDAKAVDNTLTAAKAKIRKHYNIV